MRKQICPAYSGKEERLRDMRLYKMQDNSPLTGIKGIGVDIEDISRFKKLPFSKSKKFYERVFTKKEIKYCLSKPRSHQHFAARFCAKEAFIKAIGKKIKDYKSIEILLKKGKPTISWKEISVLLSIAHEKDKAIAFVMVTN